MRWKANTTNQDARTQSPRLSEDRLQLSGDAGSDLETNKSSAPSAGLSWRRLVREYTHSSKQQSVIVLGSIAWLKQIPREAPQHFSSRPAQARMLESGAERSALRASLGGARHSSSPHVVYIFLRRKLLDHTNKRSHDPSAISGSDSAQKPVPI